MTPAELAQANTAMVYGIANEQRHLIGGDWDDLVGDGMEGLMQAAIRFDATLGVTFSGFARARVVGAMVDGYRRSTRNRYGNAPQVINLIDRDDEDGITSQPEWLGTVPSAESQVLDRLALARLLEHVGELTEKERGVVAVAMSDGGRGRFTAHAAVLGVSKYVVAQRLRSARANLRRRLAA